MSTILLSIKPEYANKILSGTKKFEFRRRLPREKIEKIIIYSTHPKMKIVGEVEVLDTLKMKKALLWENTKNHAGISRKKFREYFNDADMACAYVLGQTIKYDPPKVLSDYNIKNAPQSFIYISH